MSASLEKIKYLELLDEYSLVVGLTFRTGRRGQERVHEAYAALEDAFNKMPQWERSTMALPVCAVVQEPLVGKQLYASVFLYGAHSGGVWK